MELAPDALPSCNITLTLGNRGIYEPSLGNGSIFMVLQKPENLNQTKDSCNEYLYVKLFGQKNIVCDILQHAMSTRQTRMHRRGGKGGGIEQCAMVVAGVREGYGGRGQVTAEQGQQGGVQQPGVCTYSAPKHAAQLHYHLVLSNG